MGNEAIVKGALASGVDFVSGYPGCPSAEIGDVFGKISKNYGVHSEWSANEKVALEAAIGASFSGLKSLVNMKNFGLNVCLDSLLPLAYTGTKGAMVIVVGDDPSCWSSAQSEENSRGFAGISHIPMLEPSDIQECYDFTKFAFEISEKFDTPVIVRLTTRVAHQKGPAKIDRIEIKDKKKLGEFTSDPHRFSTMPPRILEMKKELLTKTKKIQAYCEKSKLNKIVGDPRSHKLGIITSGVSYLHTIEALEELEIEFPVLKLGFFYPLPEKKIAGFVKNLKKVLIVEELDPYLEKEITRIAKNANPKLEILGKDMLPEIGELNTEKIMAAIAKITGRKFKIAGNNKQIDLPRRSPRLCEGCPYWNIFPAVKRIVPQDTIFGGDIGCYMIAGLPPHGMQDYLFSMGASMGISHGVSKSTGQKVISFIGDATFFHAGIPGLLNAVYNRSNPLFIVLDNRITAMTGHQPNPGMGQNLMGEKVEEVKIEEIAKACGVKNIKVLDQANVKEFEEAIKEFMQKEEVSVIVCRHICKILERRLKNN